MRPASDHPTPAPDRRAATVGDDAPVSLPTVPAAAGSLHHALTVAGAPPGPVVQPTVAGYEIEAELGRGGMGVVYKARHIALNRTVALKMILAGAHAGEHELARFQAEAEAVARVAHPNIVTIFEVGHFQGLPYYSMEHCPGGGLHVLLRRGPLPPGHAAGLVERLARAMAAAHEAGIIHRDLKPSNVLLTTDGTPKVTDFGLAKRAESDHLTRTGALVGTPSYMAPEQASGSKDIGPPADVYSLGAILYECLTGRPPFQAPTPMDTALQVLHQEPVAVRALQPKAPRDLETITLKCLQKDPRRRYASAADLADDLRRFQQGEAIAARPVGPAERLGRWCRRNPAVAALAGVVFTLLMVIAAGTSALSLRLQSALARARTDREAAERDRDRATEAEREGALKLFTAYQAEARAWRSSRQVGQRFQALEAVGRALALARDRQLGPDRVAALRHEAAGALALLDLRPAEWVRPVEGRDFVFGVFDMAPTLTRYAFAGPGGTAVFGRPSADRAEVRERARLPGRGGYTTPWMSDSGRHMALACAGRVEVWRVDVDKPERVLTRPCPASYGFLRDREAFYHFTADRTMWVFELPSGKEVRSLKVPEVPTATSFRPGFPDQIALAGPTGTRVIDVTSGAVLHQFGRIAHGGWVDWHPDGELLAVSAYTSIHVYSLRLGRELWQLEHPGHGLTIGFNDTGTLLASQGLDGRLRLWCPATGRLLFATSAPASNWLRVGAGNRLSTPFPGSGRDGQWRLTEVVPSPVYRTFIAGVALAGRVRYGNLDVHPAGRLLAVGTLEGLSLIDLDTGRERELLRYGGCVQVRFLPSGELVTANIEGDQCWRWPITVGTGATLSYQLGRVTREPGTFGQRWQGRSADGKRQATVTGSGAVVTLSDHGGARTELGPHPGCTAVLLSHDGALAVTSCEKSNGVKVWDVATGRLVLDRPEQPMLSVPALSRDNRLLALAEPGGVITLVALPGGGEVVRLTDPNGDMPVALTFDPAGGRLLVTTNDSRAVHCWDLRALARELEALGLGWPGPPPAATPVRPAAPTPPAPKGSASSSAPGSAPGAALDGERFAASSRWRGAAGETRWWWQVELPEARPVGAILQINGDDEQCLRNAPRRYAWQISTDGKRWQELDETRVADERRAYRLHRLKGAKAARFVRVVIDAATGEAPALREVELFAEPGATVAFPAWAVIVSTTGEKAVPGEGREFLPLARRCKGYESMQAQSVWLGDFHEALLGPEPRPLCAFLSGNFIDWCQQKRADWRGTQEVLRAGHLPMWASCGGAQGLALLSEVGVDRPWDCPHCRDPKAPLSPIYGHIGHTETGKLVCGDYTRCVFERGPHRVWQVGDDPAFAGLPREVRVMQSHCGQIERAPKGWKLVATNGPGALTKVQCLRREGRPIYAAQFHIEMDGTPESSRAIMANFLRQARLWGGYNPRGAAGGLRGK